MGIKEILKEELAEICLPKEEEKEIRAKVSEVITKLKKVGLNPKIGGSLAKGTIIKKDTQDIDLFIVFEDEEKLKEIEDKLKKTGLNFNKRFF